MVAMGGTQEEPSILAGTGFETLARTFGDLTKADPSRVYARMPYDLVIE